MFSVSRSWFLTMSMDSATWQQQVDKILTDYLSGVILKVYLGQETYDNDYTAGLALVVYEAVVSHAWVLNRHGSTAILGSWCMAHPFWGKPADGSVFITNRISSSILNLSRLDDQIPLEEGLYDSHDSDDDEDMDDDEESDDTDATLDYQNGAFEHSGSEDSDPIELFGTPSTALPCSNDEADHISSQFRNRNST